MKKFLIAFEGLPGGGKTTLIRKLAAIFDGEFLGEIANHSKFSPNQDEYYIESELIKLRRFTMSKKKLVFFDRSFYSMMAYNYGRKMVGMNHIMDLLGDYLIGSRKPDLFVYLRIEDIRLCNKRKNREKNEADVWTREDSLVHIKNYYDNFFKKEKNIIIIETDGKAMDEIYLLLIERIKKYVEEKT